MKSKGIMFLLLAGFCQWASACNVCFGNVDDPQTRGVGAAIIVLLIVTYSLLAVMFGVFVYCFRRARKQAATV